MLAMSFVHVLQLVVKQTRTDTAEFQIRRQDCCRRHLEVRGARFWLVEHGDPLSVSELIREPLQTFGFSSCEWCPFPQRKLGVTKAIQSWNGGGILLVDSIFRYGRQPGWHRNLLRRLSCFRDQLKKLAVRRRSLARTLGKEVLGIIQSVRDGAVDLDPKLVRSFAHLRIEASVVGFRVELETQEIHVEVFHELGQHFLGVPLQT
mmetsp:Transcript_405/g.782  ORF Transcript_405/g.782 Transcript_405/m.782 type:complete len:205 (-) Transcript_405:653-1267(-)